MPLIFTLELMSIELALIWINLNGIIWPEDHYNFTLKTFELGSKTIWPPYDNIFFIMLDSPELEVYPANDC